MSLLGNLKPPLNPKIFYEERAAGPVTIALKHTQATLYLIRSKMGSQCSFTRRGVEWWWRGAKRTSLGNKVVLYSVLSIVNNVFMLRPTAY